MAGDGVQEGGVGWLGTGVGTVAPAMQLPLPTVKLDHCKNAGRVDVSPVNGLSRASRVKQMHGGSGDNGR